MAITLFTGCLTDRYQTYKLESISSDNAELINFIIYEQMYHSDIFGRRRAIINGPYSLSDGRIFLNTDPYTFEVRFQYLNAQKIIINKMILRTENRIIDLIEKDDDEIDIAVNGRSTSEDELRFIKNTRVIDIVKIYNGLPEITRLYLKFKNFDIKFSENKYFFIEGEIAIENNTRNFELETRSFVAKFKRERKTKFDYNY
jgi:hypothetical protein